MAANLIKFDRTKDIPRDVTRALQMIREGKEVLGHVREVIIQARDGDGSQSAHYDLVASEGGYEAGDYADANAAAKASFEELDSLYAKLNAGAGVGDSTGAAITQACAKHGV